MWGLDTEREHELKLGSKDNKIEGERSQHLEFKEKSGSRFIVSEVGGTKGVLSHGTQSHRLKVGRLGQ